MFSTALNAPVRSQVVSDWFMECILGSTVRLKSRSVLLNIMHVKLVSRVHSVIVRKLLLTSNGSSVVITNNMVDVMVGTCRLLNRSMMWLSSNVVTKVLINA